MKLELVLAPNSILERPCKPVKKIKQKHRELAHLMLFYMYMWKGVGLSANQVGRDIALFVADDGARKLIAFNPKIVLFCEEPEEMDEGCLSYPGLILKKSRYNKIVLDYHDIDNNPKTETFQGLMAQIIQHELLHLSGINFE